MRSARICSLLLSSSGRSGFSYLRLHAVEVAIVPYEPPATPQTPHCTFRGTRQSKKCSTYYHDKGPNALFIRFIVIAGWSGLCPHSLAFGWLLISHCHLDAEFSKWVRVYCYLREGNVTNMFLLYNE